MKIISAGLYLLNMVFSSFILYMLVFCLFFETTQLKILIVEILNFLHIVDYHANDVGLIHSSNDLILKVVSGKYSFIYYALYGTMIFIGINMLIYITGLWKVISKIIDGYSNYEIIRPNDPRNQKLFQVLDEIKTNAQSKLNIDLPDYHQFQFEIQKDDESINFHITPTQILRPTKKTLSYLESNNKRDNDIFKAIVAHEIGHFVNKDTELNQFQKGTNMLIFCIESIFHKISPKSLNKKIFMIGANLSSAGGCLGLLIASPFLLIALFLWLVLLPGVICVWINEKVTNYVFQPLKNLTGRGQEYNADSFAVKIGYGQGLFDLFTELDKTNGTTSNGFTWARFFRDSHPTSYARQKRVNELMNKLGNP